MSLARNSRLSYDGSRTMLVDDPRVRDWLRSGKNGRRCRCFPPAVAPSRTLGPQGWAVVKVMNTIDYVYRFDPHIPSTKPAPTDAEAPWKPGRRQPDVRPLDVQLPDGHLHQGGGVELCRALQRPGSRHGAEGRGGLPKQAPFAVVIGCSDARVPTECSSARASTTCS